MAPHKAQKGAPIAIDSTDILPFSDQVEHLQGDAVDVILETPGGNGTVAEDIVRILRDRFSSVSFIIPGQAKSAGTIIAMSGDEVLMDYRSAVGPIDAQIAFEGKQFSAEALLKGIEKIKEECDKIGSLNRAYIPILQRLSPGDIQNAENALDFARVLVRDWLCKYKFKNWSTHRTHNVGAPVTEAEKTARAKEIADALCDHSRWLSHGRSIRMQDLVDLGLEVVDYGKQAELEGAICRYYALLRLTFDSTPIYKIFETPNTQINRAANVTQPNLFQASNLFPGQGVTPLFPGQVANQQTSGVIIDVKCPQCQAPTKVQADLDIKKPLQSGAARFPASNQLKCAKCGTTLPLLDLRTMIEGQAGRKVISE